VASWYSRGAMSPEPSESPRKSFRALQDDYRFFEDHVSERAEALRVWRPWLRRLGGRSGRLRVLDFGAGSGSFTAEVLAALGRPPSALELALVDPAENALAEAVGRCAPWSERPVQAGRTLADLPPGPFDLVLSHHALYYVPSLDEAAEDLLGRLAEDGLLLPVVGGEGSGPGKVQEAALALAGLQSPYFSGDQVCAAFLRLAPHGRVLRFPSELRMADTRPNREALMRFLAGEFAGRLSWEEALALLDPWSDGETVVVPSEELCLAIEGRS